MTWDRRKISTQQHIQPAPVETTEPVLNTEDAIPTISRNQEMLDMMEQGGGTPLDVHRLYNQMGMWTKRDIDIRRKMYMREGLYADAE